MIIKTEGILIYKIKYSDTSQIVHLLTNDLGVRAFMVKGIRAKKSKNPSSLLEYLNIWNVVASQSVRSELLTVREISLANQYSNTAGNITQSSIFLFIAELLHKCITKPSLDLDLYNFTKKSLLYLDKSNKPIPDFHLWFIANLTLYLGIKPLNNYSKTDKYFDIQHGYFISTPIDLSRTFSETSGLLLSHYLNINIEQCSEVLAPITERSRFLDEMLMYYGFHLDHFKGMQTPTILKSVMR